MPVKIGEKYSYRIPCSVSDPHHQDAPLAAVIQPPIYNRIRDDIDVGIDLIFETEDIISLSVPEKCMPRDSE